MRWNVETIEFGNMPGRGTTDALSRFCRYWRSLRSSSKKSLLMSHAETWSRKMDRETDLGYIHKNNKQDKSEWILLSYCWRESGCSWRFYADDLVVAAEFYNFLGRRNAKGARCFGLIRPIDNRVYKEWHLENDIKLDMLNCFLLPLWLDRCNWKLRFECGYQQNSVCMG